MFDAIVKKYGYIPARYLSNRPSKETNKQMRIEIDNKIAKEVKDKKQKKQRRYIERVEIKEIVNNKKRSKKKKNNIHIKVFNKYYHGVNYCQKCGDIFELQIHHIDKNHENNQPLNLIKLCYECHCDAHKGDKVHNLMVSRLRYLRD